MAVHVPVKPFRKHFADQGTPNLHVHFVDLHTRMKTSPFTVYLEWSMLTYELRAAIVEDTSTTSESRKAQYMEAARFTSLGIRLR